MKKGRKPTITFGVHDKNIEVFATGANNDGIYTVESLKAGIIYFCENGDVTIATHSGFMTMGIETAETIASELSGIIRDVKENAHEGRTPMDAKAISNMLEVRKKC